MKKIIAVLLAVVMASSIGMFALFGTGNQTVTPTTPPTPPTPAENITYTRYDIFTVMNVTCYQSGPSSFLKVYVQNFQSQNVSSTGEVIQSNMNITIPLLLVHINGTEVLYNLAAIIIEHGQTKLLVGANGMQLVSWQTCGEGYSYLVAFSQYVIESDGTIRPSGGTATKEF